jgi:hypothetical protein
MSLAMSAIGWACMDTHRHTHTHMQSERERYYAYVKWYTKVLKIG